MEKITSFTIDHIKLQPGIYVSRKDPVGGSMITTFDIRMTSPNEEPVMNTAELHTIEHLAATFLRNHKEFGSKMIYWGPMGCRTGNYLLLNGDYESKDIVPLMIETFEFIRDFEGEVPGASAKDCGNYLDMNLPMAKYLAEKFLDEARECGVNAFTITGGEPMLHRNFMDILTGIYERGMYVEEINTNGYFLRQEVLNQMKERGIRPLMKISFDGIGHHDWLRGRKGAEEDAIRAIRLCRANDFPVMIQTNVHRHNLDTLLETAKLMDSLGVWKMRIIRTSEAPRWKENAGDAALGLTEYYDRMLEFASAYMKTGCRMDVIIWQFLRLYPVSGSYGMIPVLYREKEYRDSLPVCKGVRGMVAVAANGNIFPCHQLSGTYELNGDIPGNVKKESLKHLLSASQYLCEVCTTVDKIREHDRKCRNCKYFKYCAGGCRALAIVLTGDKLGADPSKCVFFGQGYYEKTVSALQEYENYTEIAYNPGTDI